MADFTAEVRVNPVGMTTAQAGYLSSVTVYTAGSAQALVPNTTTGIITVAQDAADALVTNKEHKFQLVRGGIP